MSVCKEHTPIVICLNFRYAPRTDSRFSIIFVHKEHLFLCLFIFYAGFLILTMGKQKNVPLNGWGEMNPEMKGLQIWGIFWGALR